MLVFGGKKLYDFGVAITTCPLGRAAGASLHDVLHL